MAMWHAADDVVVGMFAGGDGEDADGDGGVVGAEDEVGAVELDVANGALAADVDGVEVGFGGAVGLEGGEVAIEEEGGAGGGARGHGGGVVCVHLDEHEAAPFGAGGVAIGAEAFEEGFFEFEEVANVVLGDAGAGGGDGGVDEEDVVELAVGGGEDGGAFVDFGGVEEVEDGEFEDGEDAVEAFEGEGAFFVEEVGDVGLLKAG